MTDHDRREIARLVAEELSAHPRECPLGLDHATTSQLKDMADTWKKSRAALLFGVIGLLVTAGFGIFVIGMAAKIKEISK